MKFFAALAFFLFLAWGIRAWCVWDMAWFMSVPEWTAGERLSLLFFGIIIPFFMALGVVGALPDIPSEGMGD